MADNKSAPSNPAAEKTATGGKLETWFPDLSAEIVSRLRFTLDHLVKANRNVSLISATALKNAESLVLADAILGARLIQPKLVAGEPLVDLCSGSGMPGLVYAILYPTTKVVLLENDSRKQDVYKQVGEALKLPNLAVQSGTIEKLADNSVKNLVARNLSPLHRGLLISRKAVVKGGKFFQMRGDGWANELASVPSQLFSFWSPNLLGVYKLPESAEEHAVLLMDKTAD